MAGLPETRYAETAGGGRVAYQVVGDGSIDVLVTRPTQFPVDLMWEEPRLAQFLNRLSSFSRHIWFDPRGTGASDWIPHSEGRLHETVVDDMVAVLNDVGCERVALGELGRPDRVVFRGDASRADDCGGAHQRHRSLPTRSTTIRMAFQKRRSIRSSKTRVKLVHSGPSTQRRVSSTTRSSSAGCSGPGGS